MNSIFGISILLYAKFSFVAITMKPQLAIKNSESIINVFNLNGEKFQGNIIIPFFNIQTNPERVYFLNLTNLLGKFLKSFAELYLVNQERKSKKAGKVDAELK